MRRRCTSTKRAQNLAQRVNSMHLLKRHMQPHPQHDQQMHHAVAAMPAPWPLLEEATYCVVRPHAGVNTVNVCCQVLSSQDRWFVWLPRSSKGCSPRYVRMTCPGIVSQSNVGVLSVTCRSRCDGLLFLQQIYKRHDIGNRRGRRWKYMKEKWNASQGVSHMVTGDDLKLFHRNNVTRPVNRHLKALEQQGRSKTRYEAEIDVLNGWLS